MDTPAVQQAQGFSRLVLSDQHAHQREGRSFPLVAGRSIMREVAFFLPAGHGASFPLPKPPAHLGGLSPHQQPQEAAPLGQGDGRSEGLGHRFCLLAPPYLQQAGQEESRLCLQGIVAQVSGPSAGPLEMCLDCIQLFPCSSREPRPSSASAMNGGQGRAAHYRLIGLGGLWQLALHDQDLR